MPAPIAGIGAMSAVAPVQARQPFPFVLACRMLAGIMPAVVLSYSALIDPLINFGLPYGVYFGGVELESESKSEALTKLVMPAFLLLALALAAFAPPVVPARLRTIAIPAVLFLALAYLSAFWARDPTKTLTLATYQLILYGSLFLFVAVAADPKRVLQWVVLAFAVVVGANLAAMVLFPPGPIGHQGIYTFKNTLGAAGACAFVFGLFHLFEGRLFWRATAWFTTIGALVVTVASDSKTALALMAVAPALAIVFYAAIRLLALGPILVGGLLMALGVFGYFTLSAMLGTDIDDFLLATYGDTTFTGRTEVWAFAYDYILQSPIVGNGYRAFWSLGSASPKHGSEIEFIRTIGSGHSGFVDIALDLGLLGLALLFAVIVASFSIAGRVELRPASRSLLYLAIMVLAVGRNTMESVILWSTFFDNLAFILVGFLACYREPPKAAFRVLART